MHRGTWWATVHRVAKSQTQLKRLNMHAHTHTHACTHKWIKRTNQNTETGKINLKIIHCLQKVTPSCPTLCDPMSYSL